MRGLTTREPDPAADAIEIMKLVLPRCFVVNEGHANYEPYSKITSFLKPAWRRSLVSLVFLFMSF